MTNIPKPTAAAIKVPEAALVLLTKFYEALRELQATASDASPESVAGGTGVAEIVVLRGATVTLPGSATTFTADLYVTGIRT